MCRSPNPAIMNNTLHSYLALDAEHTHEQQLEGSEVLGRPAEVQHRSRGQHRHEVHHHQE